MTTPWNQTTDSPVCLSWHPVHIDSQNTPCRFFHNVFGFFAAVQHTILHSGVSQRSPRREALGSHPPRTIAYDTYGLYSYGLYSYGREALGSH